MESELKQVEFIQRVRQALQERLSANPELSELASDLGVSARTLVRRLMESGLTYSDIKDDLRKSHAAWYLQHTELSMSVIASQLGYHDPTNFSRKFKDWYRMPPSKMRHTLRKGIDMKLGKNEVRSSPELLRASGTPKPSVSEAFSTL